MEVVGKERIRQQITDDGTYKQVTCTCIYELKLLL